MIQINGKSYQGNSVSIVGDKIYIDGQLADSDTGQKEINIIVNGNLDKLECGYGKITVVGAVGSIETKAGNVEVKGDVSGHVETMSGNVKIGGQVKGSVKTMSGNINHR